MIFTSFSDEELEAEDELESPTMLVSLPQCDSETGDYSSVQTQGDLSWCVTPDGQPIPESLTRGKVSCSSNGMLNLLLIPPQVAYKE
jgi:hypothetical protein